LKEYESTLENVMSKFRGVAVRDTSTVMINTDKPARFTTTRPVSTFLLYNITVLASNRTFIK
jgi:hypothetical protein